MPRSFFARDTVEVAAALVGMWLVRGDVVLRITEVEAYCPGDSASHCRAGRTARNAAMWGPPGCAYVYLCYGLHNMLNLVTERDGVGAAVLIRSCELVAGSATVLARRNVSGPASPTLLAGPGKVGQALALDPSWSGHPLLQTGGLELRRAAAPSGLLRGPRVGIEYARPRDRAAPWRFAAADSASVTERARLRAWSPP